MALQRRHRPILALADGSQKAGHQVTLVVSGIDNQSYRSLCEQMHVGYRQVPERFDLAMEGFAVHAPRMNFLE